MTGNNEVNYWSDICFLSRKDKNIFYNAEIVTCQYNLIERITNEAYDDVNSKLPEQCWYDYDRHVELDNMTIDEYVQKYVNDVLKTKPQTYEEYHVYGDFKCGVGVMLVVDVNNLTCDIINEHVNRFLDSGEISWKNSLPAKNIVYNQSWIYTAYKQINL